MSFISDYVTPFFQAYTRSLDGDYIATQLQFKGSKEIGGDYINKINRAQRRNIQNRFRSLYVDTTTPSRLSRNLPSSDSSKTTSCASSSTVCFNPLSLRQTRRRLPGLPLP